MPPSPATAPSLSHPAYRPDIDGLRAIAVLSVIIFHASPRWLPGGFVGVDIFFVISGFLISTIMFGSLAGGGFSYAEFYARRIRRIFPGLVLVLIATLAFGWWVLLADEFRQLGKHVLASAGFVANLVLWGEAGYFDTVVETKPLLHLWSLAVEEQFYIFWPLLLTLAWKRQHLLRWMGVAVGLSFLLNVGLVMRHPDAAFYMPFTRVWELGAGAMLA
ncbi:MAG: acyltransferase family protein, partial [Gammaproteobacteria bacterium]